MKNNIKECAMKIIHTREKYIKDKLQCEFIRYKPCDEDFNIFEVINSIYQHIKKN